MQRRGSNGRPLCNHAPGCKFERGLCPDAKPMVVAPVLCHEWVYEDDRACKRCGHLGCSCKAPAVPAAGVRVGTPVIDGWTRYECCSAGWIGCWHLGGSTLHVVPGFSHALLSEPGWYVTDKTRAAGRIGEYASHFGTGDKCMHYVEHHAARAPEPLGDAGVPRGFVPAEKKGHAGWSCGNLFVYRMDSGKWTAWGDYPCVATRAEAFAAALGFTIYKFARIGAWRWNRGVEGSCGDHPNAVFEACPGDQPTAELAAIAALAHHERAAHE